MPKRLMPYGSPENASIMNKSANTDTGKLAELFEQHLKRTKPEPAPQAPVKTPKQD